ncbi:MAG: biosynthetic peptidoglycan transglycosylase [Anaeromyxobacter sp.]
MGHEPDPAPRPDQPDHHRAHRAAPGRGQGAQADAPGAAELGGAGPHLTAGAGRGHPLRGRALLGYEGIDWEATRDAAQHDLARGRFARGASTITQQLAKNLWFGTEKSLWRKLKEAVLAAKLERSLSKKRILALYLNVVELDDGVFGIEAGARARFGVSAAGLSTAQAVVLASILPAPRRADLDHPSTWLKRRSRRLLERMASAGRITAAEHARAKEELERILAGAAPADDVEEPPEEEAPVAATPEPAARDEAGVPAAPASGEEVPASGAP